MDPSEKIVTSTHESRVEAYLKSKKEIAKENRRKNIRRLFRNKKLVFGGVMLIIIVTISILAPKIAPYSYRDMGPDILVKPCAEHLLGTDKFGRDLFSRVLYGSRTSLFVALMCVMVGTVLGVPLGMLAGYIGGLFDVIVMRICDTVMSIPWILMAVTVTAILGPGIQVVIIALGLVYTPGTMRLTRSLVLSIRAGSARPGYSGRYAADPVRAGRPVLEDPPDARGRRRGRNGPCAYDAGSGRGSVQYCRAFFHSKRAGRQIHP